MLSSAAGVGMQRTHGLQSGHNMLLPAVSLTNAIPGSAHQPGFKKRREKINPGKQIHKTGIILH